MKFVNETHIEGYLYEHNLEMKESGPNSKNPGTPFISGTISIVTDNALTNVLQVHFTYVTETTSKGKTNATFTTLRKIIDGEYNTVMGDGVENATRIRVDSTERCKFKTTMLITKAVRTESNPEKETPEKVTISGYAFDFRKALLPVSYTVLNEGGMNYFEGLEASEKNPVLTEVWGKQVSRTVVKKVTKESSWGDAEVQEFKNTYKDYVITGSQKEPFVFDMEDTYTSEELTKAIADRETYLATIKQRRDEYLATKNNGGAKQATASNGNAGFNF